MQYVSHPDSYSQHNEAQNTQPLPSVLQPHDPANFFDYPEKVNAANNQAFLLSSSSHTFKNPINKVHLASRLFDSCVGRYPQSV